MFFHGFNDLAKEKLKVFLINVPDQCSTLDFFFEKMAPLNFENRLWRRSLDFSLQDKPR
jgi:hypothetical protein